MEMVGTTDLDAALAAADCVVIVTDHDAYEWTGVRCVARLLSDTRHVAKIKPAELEVEST
jgi:UDP-N-acetyl-D-glucosamine dehydrogenase